MHIDNTRNEDTKFPILVTDSYEDIKRVTAKVFDIKEPKKTKEEPTAINKDHNTVNTSSDKQVNNRYDAAVSEESTNKWQNNITKERSEMKRNNCAIL